MLTCPHGHYEVWEQWQETARSDRSGLDSLIATDEYEEWPRGRIVYSSPHDRFVLYADAQILRRPDLLATIRERFGLPADRTDTDGIEARHSLRQHEAIGRLKYIDVQICRGRKIHE